MAFNNSFFRNLCRNRLHTFINLTGLSLSLAVVILLSAYLVGEWRVNSRIPEADRVYLLAYDDGRARVPESMLPKLKNDIPGIKDATMWQIQQREFTGDFIKGNVLETDTSFFKIFGVELISGTMEGFNSREVILTTDEFHEIAKKNEHDQAVSAYGMGSKPIIGVLPAPDHSLSFKYDVIVCRDEPFSFNGFSFDSDYPCAILLDEKANPDTIQARINSLTREYDTMKDTRIHLVPFKDVYFETSLRNDDMAHANTPLIRLMLYITLGVLVLALLNYINLTSTRAFVRWREVGIQKTLGAGNNDIFKQFMIETYQLLTVALLLALLLALLGKPYFDSLLGKTVSFSAIFGSVSTILAFVCCFVVFGGITGIIPALSANRISPLLLMGKQTLPAKRNFLRQGLTILQFIVSIVLVFSMFMVYRQVDYVKHRSLGFPSDLLLYLRTPELGESDMMDLKETFLTDPGIEQVTLSNGGPGFLSIRGLDAGKTESVHMHVDTDFLNTFDLKLLKGRNITENMAEGSLINETAYYAHGGGDIDTMMLAGQYPVCGVVQDFHVEDMHHAIPEVYIYPCYGQSVSRSLTVRLRPENVDATMKFIEKSVLKYSVYGVRFNYTFYDDHFNSLYHEEENQAKAIRLFTILALLISCMGMFGLAEFHTRRRIKEIGIRRVNGATVSEILLHLNWQFLVPVLIAFVIACPIGWYVMDRWLQRFAYRADMSWWIFALAGLVALTVALLTVSWQSWRAATRNPVDSLHHE